MGFFVNRTLTFQSQIFCCPTSVLTSWRRFKLFCSASVDRYTAIDSHCEMSHTTNAWRAVRRSFIQYTNSVVPCRLGALWPCVNDALTTNADVTRSHCFADRAINRINCCALRSPIYARRRCMLPPKNRGGTVNTRCAIITICRRGRRFLDPVVFLHPYVTSVIYRKRCCEIAHCSTRGGWRARFFHYLCALSFSVFKRMRLSFSCRYSDERQTAVFFYVFTGVFFAEKLLPLRKSAPTDWGLYRRSRNLQLLWTDCIILYKADISGFLVGIVHTT